MDQKTLELRGIKISNEIRLFFTPTKQSYSKLVEKIETWKKMGKKKKLGLARQVQSYHWTSNGNN